MKEATMLVIWVVVGALLAGRYRLHLSAQKSDGLPLHSSKPEMAEAEVSLRWRLVGEVEPVGVAAPEGAPETKLWEGAERAPSL
jgi:hypothetical protein